VASVGRTTATTNITPNTAECDDRIKRAIETDGYYLSLQRFARGFLMSSIPNRPRDPDRMTMGM